MRGSPLRELILMLVLVALLAPVILGLTKSPEVVALAPPSGELSQNLVSATIRLQFAHPPTRASLGSEGQLLWDLSTDSKQTEYEEQRLLDLGEGILELPVSAVWPEGTPNTAITITVEPDGMEAREVTFWSEDKLVEFIELNWNE